MGVVTHLERAIWEVAEPIRATRFARILRNARIADRDPSLPGPDEETQGWELSFDPAIQRTLGATIALAIRHEALPDMDSEWVRWNLSAKKAVTRMAAKCWAGIDRERRLIFLDEDNFQPIWGQSNVYDLRSETLGRHLEFEGLSDPNVRSALNDVYEAARDTPAYREALRADRRLATSGISLKAWSTIAKKGHKELETALREVPIGDGARRGLEIIRTAYTDTSVEDLATAFRRYNRLVQHIIWSILGLAEAAPGPLVLTDSVGTLRCVRGSDGSPFIRLTSREATENIMRVTHPVWLNMGSPLDGLHLLVGYTMTLASGAASDLSLTPIRSSAGSWPTMSYVGVKRDAGVTATSATESA